MNFKGTKKPLFIQPTPNDKNSVYITTGQQEYAPAIAAVFGNIQAGVEDAERDANARAFAAMPELVAVLDAAEKLILSRAYDGKSVDRLRKAVDAAKTRAGIE